MNYYYNYLITIVFIIDNYLYIMRLVGAVIPAPTTHFVRLHLSFKLYNYMMTLSRLSGPLYITPTNKTYLRPEENKEICINILGLCYC